MHPLVLRKRKVMTHLIVPTDFSDTSKNAVKYACQLALDLQEAEIILFHSYENEFSGSDGSPLAGQEDASVSIMTVAMENIRNEYATTNQKVSLVIQKGSFLKQFQDLLSQYDDCFVVMGLRGASRVEQFFIGSSALRVAEQVKCPVMIIPPHAVYQKINSVIFSSDLRNVTETTPIDALRSFLRLFMPKLIVAYVNMDQQDSGIFKQEKSELDVLLREFWPEYQIIRINDFAKAIHDLAIEKQADLIITVPRKHGFWERVFTTSHTSKLAYHTDIPLLTVHE